MAQPWNPGQWQRIDELFTQALDLPPDQRLPFLAQACPEDDLLRAEVEKMLANASRSHTFLETPALEQAARQQVAAAASSPAAASPAAASPAASAAGSAHGNSSSPAQANRHASGYESGTTTADARNLFSLPLPAIPQRLGPYRILQQLGHGGMGTVYEAIRDDGNFSQRVAVKLIRPGLDTAEILDRFRRERQILATLNHPNICRLVDGGTSPDGRPFFVMELIEGRTLIDHCQRAEASLEERLRLFRDVCAAVAHAHQSLIVHRDLKPANIMVTRPEAGQPQVKLLDFGIAKLLQAEPNDPSMTRAATSLLTPDYASPEQVKGEPVTTATDVYALGLILYELLTGKKAQRATSSAMADIERAVCETSPAMPSTLSLEGVSHPPTKLKGDLDNIVLKALQKQPQRRYQSVLQFSEDIGRYTDGFPVSARPDSVVYKFEKFVLRNKWAIAAGLALGVAIAGGVYSTLRQAAIAQEHFNSVRGLSRSLLTEVDASAMNVPGAIKTRRLIVQRTIEYLDKLSATAQNDPDLMAELAEAYKTAGSIQGNRNRPNIGDYKGAMVSFRKSLELRRRIEQIRPDKLNRLEIPLTGTEAARIFPATPESDALIQESLQVAEALAKEFPGKYKLPRANVYFTLGYVQFLKEQYAEAITNFEKCRQFFLEMNRPKNNLAVCDRYIALCLHRAGRKAESVARITQALAVDKEHVAKVATPRSRMDISYNYVRRANFHADAGRLAEAMQDLVEAEAIRQELAKADKDDLRNRIALMETNQVRGEILTRQGKLAEGAKLLEEVVANLTELARKDPESLEDRLGLALGQVDLARNYRLSGRCADADQLVAQARQTLSKDGGPWSQGLLSKLPACAARP